MRRSRNAIRSMARRAAAVACVLARLLLYPAPRAARDLPPYVPPPRSPVLPAPALRVLPNHLQVVVVERHSLPLVTLRLVTKSGPEADPPDLPGTAELVAALLGQGTHRRSAQEIAREIDSAGGELETGAEWDNSYAALTVLSDHAEFAFDLISDIALHPAFSPAEIERQRQQTLSALEVLAGDPAYLADAALDRILLNGTSYSHLVDGTVESVQRVKAQDLEQFHDRYYKSETRHRRRVCAIARDLARRGHGAQRRLQA